MHLAYEFICLLTFALTAGPPRRYRCPSLGLRRPVQRSDREQKLHINAVNAVIQAVLAHEMNRWIYQGICAAVPARLQQ